MSSSVCSSPRSQRSSSSSASASGPPSPQTAATTPRSCYGDFSPKPALLHASLPSLAHLLTPPPETDDDADDDADDEAMALPMPITMEYPVKSEEQQQQHLSSFYPMELDDDAQQYCSPSYSDYSYGYDPGCGYSYDTALADPFCYYHQSPPFLADCDDEDDFSPVSPCTATTPTPTPTPTSTSTSTTTTTTTTAGPAGLTEPTAPQPPPPAGLAGLGLATAAVAGWAEYSQWTGYTGYPPAEAFYGPLSLPLPGAWACPSPPPVDPTAEWFTADGKRVEYSAMHLHCATM